jgi:acyl-CoA thioester hydrolase
LRIKTALPGIFFRPRCLKHKPNTVTEFVWPVRVYYEDTDSGGVVYHANYLKFMERARTEWLRSLGFEQDQLVKQHGVIFAVRAASLDFHKPARFNDRLEVSVRIAEKRPASIGFEHNVRRAGPERELVCAGHVRVACLEADTFRPRPIPKPIFGEFPDAG